MTRTIPVIERQSPVPGYLSYHNREYIRHGRLVPRVSSARNIAEKFEETGPFMAIIVKVKEGSYHLVGYYVYLYEAN